MYHRKLQRPQRTYIFEIFFIKKENSWQNDIKAVLAFFPTVALCEWHTALANLCHSPRNHLITLETLNEHITMGKYYYILKISGNKPGVHAAPGHTSESVFRSGNRFLEDVTQFSSLTANPPSAMNIQALSIHPPPSQVPILENGIVGAVLKTKIF